MELKENDVLSWSFQFEGTITVMTDSKEAEALDKIYMSGNDEYLKLDSLGYHGRVVVVDKQVVASERGLEATFYIRAVRVDQ